MSTKMIAVSVGVVALVAALVISPRSHLEGSVAAADVRTAMQNINTWHLKGTRRYEDRDVLWEVWGRRQPYFYREQIGDRIVFDDGSIRVHIIPPDTGVGIPDGIYLRTPSFPEEGNAPWLYNAMVSSWRGIGSAKPWKQTEGRHLFRESSAGKRAMTETIYSVDDGTKLPVRYEVRKTLTDGTSFTADELNAEYSAPIPDTITIPPAAPDGYRKMDALEPRSPDVPVTNASTLRGITIQAQPLAMDRAGNFLVSVRGWIGNTPINRNSSPYLYAGVAGPMRHPKGAPEGNWDNRGRVYVGVAHPAFSFTRSRLGDELMLVVPVEPITSPSILPKTLNLNLWSSVWVSARASGDSIMMSPKQLFGQELSCRITLPTRPTQLDIDSFLEPNWRAHFRYQEEVQLPTLFAEARSGYYHGKINEAIAPSYGTDDADYQPNPRFPARVDKAMLRGAAAKTAAWIREAIRLTTPGSRKQHMLRGRLLQEMEYGAHWMNRIGDRANAATTWREVIAESERHPEVSSVWRKQAEKGLASIEGTGGHDY